VGVEHLARLQHGKVLAPLGIGELGLVTRGERSAARDHARQGMAKAP
jgi:hypothetical protein